MNIKEFFEDLKKDKKKMFFALMIPLFLIVSVVLGIVFSGENEVIVNNEVKTDALVVPVDSLNKKEQKSKSQMYASSFFSEEERPVIEEVNDNEPIVGVKKTSNNPYAYSTKKNNAYSGSEYQLEKSQKKSSVNDKQNESQEIEAETPVKKRRRAPNDGMGNYSASNKNMFTAVIANDNLIVKSGSKVSIRVAEEIKIGDVVIARNSIVTGIAAYNNQRMHIKISSVKVGTTYKPVKWVIVGEDGIIGVPVPESVLNDIMKDGTGDVIDDGGSKIEAKVPIVGSVKVNLNKKTKEVSFVINTGDKVYIKEDK